MFLRILINIGLIVVLGMTGPVNEGQHWTEFWGQPAGILNLTGGLQTATPINLVGARNEYLFFMVILERGSSSLKVRLEGLPAGLEWQVFRVVPAPLSVAEKFPPDALLPLSEAFGSLSADPQPLWFSLKIGPDCLPGSYSSKLAISDHGKTASLPIELKIYRFSLPEDLPITIWGGLWHQPEFWSQYARGLSGAEIRLIKSYCKSLRDYKFNGLGGSYPLPLGKINRGQKIEDFSTYHELLNYVLNDLKFKYFQIPRIKGWESVGGPESDFRLQAGVFYPLYSDYLRRHGWEGQALNYLVDEPRPDQHQAVMQACGLSKSLAPGIRTLSAGWQPCPDFAEVIDIWAYQAAHYRQDERDRAVKQGQEAWLYANRLQGIDHPLAHQRLIGWLLYRYQFAGYLLWGVNFWPQDPWTTPPGPHDFFRRGTFYYPHPETGLPVPTTRLEALRRGFQDYQYLQLLDEACRRGLIPREKQDLVLAKVNRFTDGLARNSFPVCMAELDSVHRSIGEFLDEVSFQEAAQ